MPEERGRRYPPWHEEMPASLCEGFFQMEEDNRRRVMGEIRHYCKFPLLGFSGGLFIDW